MPESLNFHYYIQINSNSNHALVCWAAILGYPRRLFGFNYRFRKVERKDWVSLCTRTCSVALLKIWTQATPSELTLERYAQVTPKLTFYPKTKASETNVANICRNCVERRTANWQNRVIILASTQNACRAELRPRLTVAGNISKCTLMRRTVTPA